MNIEQKGCATRPSQAADIKAIKAVYVAATLKTSDAAIAVTSRAVQSTVSSTEHLNLSVGTMLINAVGLNKVWAGYWGSLFVHEGTHMVHKEAGTPSAERRAYHEQFGAARAFGLTPDETTFLKNKCGSACN